MRIPNHTVRDSSARLECHYALDQEVLYSVKWYKDGNEFYRYVPRDMPPAQVFPLPGVSIDVSIYPRTLSLCILRIYDIGFIYNVAYYLYTFRLMLANAIWLVLRKFLWICFRYIYEIYWMSIFKCVNKSRLKHKLGWTIFLIFVIDRVWFLKYIRVSMQHCSKFKPVCSKAHETAVMSYWRRGGVQKMFSNFLKT